MKWIMFILFIGAGILGLGVLFNDISQKQAEAAASKAEAGTTLKVTMSNWKFDQAEYQVKAGETKKVTLVLAEGVHELNIPDLGIKLNAQNRQAEVKFDKPGKFEMHCSLPCGQGHEQMKATLVVQ
ncbi:cupredoxin domain-containing protein [Gordoniibacillus kamchatkensis]|nr:cupredoxin domain-containing protein [Paenibacillus sp. VKM B-2647]